MTTKRSGIDYSKWDNLTVSDEEDDQQKGAIVKTYVLNRDGDGYIQSGDEAVGVGGVEGKSVWKLGTDFSHFNSQPTQAPVEPVTAFDKFIVAATQHGSRFSSLRPTRQSKKSVKAPPPRPAPHTPPTWNSSVLDDSSSAESEGDRWLEPIPLVDEDLPAGMTLNLRSDLWPGNRPTYVERGQRLK